ncbi:PREDICTED: centromere-associated protein E [Papilio polytes]|uniref:centromere-associated protein E n=1 Tax=Papilio polytes TaxID=76194 RepID=UPI000675C675|nr:PREDICTED: centromere-associated protein E [Papilio polytes]
MDDEYVQFAPRVTTYSNVNKRNLVKKSPKKLTFTGNFTPCHRHFYITEAEKRNSLRLDILNAVMKRTESKMQKDIEFNDNPLYEDPRDVIDGPVKPLRKRNIHGNVANTSKEGKHLIKEQKKKLNKKYERLITALMDRCEENIVSISEKDAHIAKLKEKLKTILEYNKLFASENDRLKCEHSTLIKYAEECKTVIKEEREKNADLEDKCKSLQERVRQYDIPDKDQSEPTTAIPLVEVCMNCSSRQIVLNQAKELNSRLQKDMQALKDVLYRLNVQLARYQEKLRSNVPTLQTDKSTDKYDCIDSLINASLGQRRESTTEETAKKDHEGNQARMVDLSGLLSAQALAPLFDSYQENLQEKDNLINDYEKQFENMNKKSKEIVNDNKSLSDKVTALENELSQVRQSYKKLVVERETADIEKATLLERAERAESKLKEVYELYEDKMAAMIRDYETVHREYFAVKNALEASAGKITQLDAMRARTVPADLHERRLDHCKRLLEELKHQYSMENERKTEQVKKLQEDIHSTEEKYNKVCQEHEAIKEELRTALKNVRCSWTSDHLLSDPLLVCPIFLPSSSSTRPYPLLRVGAHALLALDTIKTEIKAVKSRAYTSLEELERRIVQQERRAAAAQAEHRRELERAAAALEHKEGIIRSLIDKVADVEEVRLSQTNAHRLQGIVSNSSSDSSSVKEKDKKDMKNVKLVPSSGGYYQDKEKRKGNK